MKGFLLSATAIIALALPAAAADMPQKSPQYATPPVVKCSWCGFQGGVHGGYGWGFTTPDIDISPFADPKQKGWTAGVYAKYLWQPGAGPFLFGLGLDYDYADIKDSQTIGGLSVNTKFEHFASARAYAGVALGEWMISGNAGLAFAKATASVDVVGFGPIATANENLYGWVLGAGLDYKIAEHIILGVEYSHYDFGKHDYQFTLGGSGGPILGVKADTTADIVKAKLGFRF